MIDPDRPPINPFIIMKKKNLLMISKFMLPFPTLPMFPLFNSTVIKNIIMNITANVPNDVTENPLINDFNLFCEPTPITTPTINEITTDSKNNAGRMKSIGNSKMDSPNIINKLDKTNNENHRNGIVLISVLDFGSIFSTLIQFFSSYSV